MAPMQGDMILCCVTLCILSVILSVDCIKYDRNTLLNLWDVNFKISFTDYDNHIDILGPNRFTTSDFQFPKCKQRKRGKRAGALVRFRRRTSRPPLPSIYLSNL